MSYTYADDPYLTPYSNHSKRTYALSMESGKKAALWIRQQHADLFNHRVADPMINAFIPKAEYTEKTQVSESILLHAIKHAQVEEAETIYKLLEGDISDEAKLAYFQMLCYYNSQEPTETEFLLQKWMTISDVPKTFWRKNPDLDKLFAHLKNCEEKIAASAYNTMISAYGKYSQKNAAIDLVKECESRSISLNTTAYNHLIALQANSDLQPKARWLLVREFLVKMKNNNVAPNIQTLNACIQVLAMNYVPGITTIINNLMMNFRLIGIKPCLTTYYYILKGFRKNGEVAHKYLADFVEELESQGELQIRDSLDTFFFSAAMSFARECFDLELAERIHNVLLFKQNYKFIGDAYRESIYYRHYLSLLLSTKSLPDFYKIYQNFVPNVYIPEPKVMKDIIQAMSNNEPQIVAPMIPMIWSHTVTFDLIDKLNIKSLLFDLMVDVGNALGDDKQITKEHGYIAVKCFEIMKERIVEQKRRNKFQMPAKFLENLFILMTKNEMFDDVVKLFNFIRQNMDQVVDDISPEVIRKLFEQFVKKNDVKAAFYALDYTINCGYENELENMVKQIKKVELSSKEEKLFKSLVGVNKWESFEKNEKNGKSEELNDANLVNG